MKNELMNYDDVDESFFSPLFDLFAPATGAERRYNRGLAMKTDIKSDDKDYTMEVELPGIKKENVAVDLKNGYLTISVREDHNENEEGKKHFVHRERYIGSATRSYYVGNVSKNDVHASFNNGILTLVFPKEEHREENQTRIAIQ